MPTEKLGPSGAQPRPSSIEEKAAGRALCRILKFLTVGLSTLFVLRAEFPEFCDLMLACSCLMHV